LIYNSSSIFDTLAENDLVVSFQIPQEIKKEHNNWLDLDTLNFKTNKDFARHFAIFLRRYGIRTRELTSQPASIL